MRLSIGLMVGAGQLGAIRAGAEAGCDLPRVPIGEFTDGGLVRRADHRRMDDWLCTLQDAAGRVETCPGERCPLWLDDACTIGGLRADLYRNPSLVAHLLRLREQLAGGTRSIFGLLPPGLRS